jgi:hypothetical protein
MLVCAKLKENYRFCFIDWRRGPSREIDIKGNVQYNQWVSPFTAGRDVAVMASPKGNAVLQTGNGTITINQQETQQ